MALEIFTRQKKERIDFECSSIISSTKTTLKCPIHTNDTSSGACDKIVILTHPIGMPAAHASNKIAPVIRTCMEIIKMREIFINKLSDEINKNILI
jgi:hypothetical protein